MTELRIPPRYLGDGVYASFDGLHIWLKTERDGITHEIALDPEVFDALHCFEQDIRTVADAVAKLTKDEPS